MLGLVNSLSAGSVLSQLPNGGFEVSGVLPHDVDFFKILVRNIKHEGDTNFTDEMPGILLLDLVVKVNGVVNTSFNLDSNNLGADATATATNILSNNALNVDVDNISAIYAPAKEIYSDDSVDSISAGSTVTVTGRVVLNDGENNTYDGSSGIPSGQYAYMAFRTNANDANDLQVFLDPNTPASQGIGGAGNWLSFTKTTSSPNSPEDLVLRNSFNVTSFLASNHSSYNTLDSLATPWSVYKAGTSSATPVANPTRALFTIDSSGSNVNIFQPDVFDPGSSYQVLIRAKASDSLSINLAESQGPSTSPTPVDPVHIASVPLTTSYKTFLYKFTAVGDNNANKKGDIFIGRHPSHGAGESFEVLYVSALEIGNRLSDELYTVANAVSMTNEANSVTGWSGGDATVDSVETSHGDYALKYTVDSNGGRAYIDLDSILTAEKVYKLEIDVKHAGGDLDSFMLQFNSQSTLNPAANDQRLIATITNTDTDYQRFTWYFKFNDSHRYFGVKESSTAGGEEGVNNASGYLDRLSIKEIIPL